MLRVARRDGEKGQAEGARSVVLELRVAPGDRGRVIGEQGRIVDALRVLLRAAVARRGKRVALMLVRAGRRRRSDPPRPNRGASYPFRA